MRALDLMPGHTPGYSQLAEINSDVYNICTRIQQCDESGWRGDTSASVMFNPYSQQFEVWLVDGQNTPYIAATSDRCDHQLILKLIEGDWQKGRKLLEELQTKNRKAHSDRIAADREKTQEIAEKLHWAIIKDVGHLEGGSRPFQSFYTKGK